MASCDRPLLRQNISVVDSHKWTSQKANDVGELCPKTAATAMGITWLAFDMSLMTDDLALLLTVGVQGTSLQPASAPTCLQHMASMYLIVPAVQLS